MEITIETDIRESAVQIHKLQWQLFLKKYYLWITLFAVTGAVFIIVNFKGDSPYDLAFGMGLVLFAFIQIFGLVRLSEKSYDQLKLEIAKRSVTDPINRIILNDLKFSYENKDVKVEASWTVFRSYKIYKGCIFFVLTSYIDSYVLRGSDMSESEFSAVSTFISQILPEKSNWK